MIYRFRSAFRPFKAGKDWPVSEDVERPGRSHGKLPWIHPSLGGAWERGCLGVEVPSPRAVIHNPRARFWFTERGFHRFGPGIVAEARREGQVLAVMRRKEPSRSQVVYRDEWQVAILPDKGR